MELNGENFSKDIVKFKNILIWNIYFCENFEVLIFTSSKQRKVKIQNIQLPLTKPIRIYD